MKRALFIAILSASTWVQAAPVQQEDASMEAFLAERGLIANLGSKLSGAKDVLGTQASDLVASAMGLLGVPYKYGGNDPKTGLDCSGLVRLVFEETMGKLLPRRASEQAAATETIDRSELKPGDLVFFNTMRRAFSHVGIYVGEGKFIHAPRSGAEVRVEDMRQAYWSKRFDGARRVAKNTGAASSR